MSEVLAAMVVAAGAVLGLKAVWDFFNVTLWQCTQFGNCPWYLRWLK